MKTIETLVLNGFQSHIQTRLELSPGMNVIVGESDAGKTALIRALRWVLFNSPTGEAFINTTLEKSEVSISFSDDSQIIRVRGKSDNYYRTYDKDQVEQKYTGFGILPPDEVYVLTGIFPATFGYLNFGLQHEPPFLLSEPGTQAARILGKLANTEDIDLAAKDVNGDLYRARQEKKTLEFQIENIVSDLKKYEFLGRAINLMEILKDMIQNHQETKQLYFLLTDLCDRDLDVGSDLVLHKNTLAYLRRVGKLAEKIIQLEHCIKLIQKYTNQRKVFDLILAGIEYFQNILANTATMGELAGKINIIDMCINEQQVFKKLSDAAIDNSIALSKNLIIFGATESWKVLYTYIAYLKNLINKATSLTKIYSKRVLSGCDLIEARMKFEKLENDFDPFRVSLRQFILSDTQLNKLYGIQTAWQLAKQHYEQMKSQKITADTLDLTTRVKMRELYKIMKICPVCNSEINETKINTILGGL